MTRKNLKEIILYLTFGVLTTIVSIAVFGLFNKICGWNEHISNVISWIASVTFAFFTNRRLVFEATTQRLSDFIKQLISFFSGRLFTLLIEELILYVFVTSLSFDSMIIKICAQLLVIVLNYVISKLIIFRKK